MVLGRPGLAALGRWIMGSSKTLSADSRLVREACLLMAEALCVSASRASTSLSSSSSTACECRLASSENVTLCRDAVLRRRTGRPGKPGGGTRVGTSSRAEVLRPRDAPSPPSCEARTLYSTSWFLPILRKLTRGLECVSRSESANVALSPLTRPLPTQQQQRCVYTAAVEGRTS